MRYLLLAILLLAACTTQTPAPDNQAIAPVIEDAPIAAIPENVTLDPEDLLENASSNETLENPSLEETDLELLSGNNATPAGSNLSITERYERDFLSLERPYLYLIDVPEYGEMWYINQVSREKYTSPDFMFEALENGSIVPSKWPLETDEEYFYYQIKHREIRPMDYIGRENGSYYGCYVKTGYYTLDNCMKDNMSIPVVYWNLTFDAPESPLDWLRKYHGKEPIRAQYNYTDKEDNLVRYVDKITFQNPDNTTTELIVHAGYHIPVKVNIYGPDRKLKERIEYKYLTTSLAQMKRWAPWFFDT